jgi:hypothetical protein
MLLATPPRERAVLLAVLSARCGALEGKILTEEAKGSAMNPIPTCWICRQRPADSSEHRFKASDFRARALGVSQKTPVFLQRDGEATNIQVGGSKSRNLKFGRSICSYCNNTLTQPYDRAWERLSDYLHEDWKGIRRRRSFRPSVPFPRCPITAGLRVHLYFVKMLGCKILEDDKAIDLQTFSTSLLEQKAHPEISIFVADCLNRGKEALMFDSDVVTTTNQTGEIDAGVWLYRIHPIAIKVAYIKAGAPLFVAGFPWRPAMTRNLVRLSPYKGMAEPLAAQGAWLD